MNEHEVIAARQVVGRVSPMLVRRGVMARELGPATSANWKFVLGHLQPVLGEHEPVSFFTLGGAVLGLLQHRHRRGRGIVRL